MNAISRVKLAGLAIALMTGLMQPGFAGTAGGGTGSPVPISLVHRVAVNQINRMKLEKVRASKQFYKAENELHKIRTEPPTVSNVYTRSKEGVNTYHIVNLKPEGWVIVSADYVASPIIGASDKGYCSATTKNCGFNAWMENVNNEIHYAATHHLSSHQKALDAWQNLEAPADAFLAQESAKIINLAPVASVSPLLTTIWGQGGNQPGFEPCATWLIPWLIGYDAYCPYEKNWAGYYQVAPTGCVATATGQVMKYWSWPAAGEGSHTSDPPYVPGTTCITESTYGPYTVNYAARTYDWAIMPNDVWALPSGWGPASTYEVAKLLRDVGNAVDMDYTPSGSGAYTSWIPGVLRSHFRYSNSAVFRYKSNYASTWIVDLKTELDAGRPLVYSGAAPDGTGGHAFVLDGYDASGLFHINWGWEGWLDGYYNVDALTVFDLLSLSTHDFTAYQGGIFFLQPDYPPTAANDSYSMNEDQSLYVAATGVLGNDSDPGGDSLSAAVDTWPSHGSLSLYANGSFIYTPTLHYVGADSFTYHASDGRYSSDSATVSITVNRVNHAPVFVPIGSRTVNENQLLQFTVAATDFDGNALTYSASNLPSGASFDPATRTFSWTPTYSQAGSYPNILFTVLDDGTPSPLQSSESITITVYNVNRAPVLATIGTRQVNEAQLLQFVVQATDPDGNGLTFSASNLPPGASFNPSTRTFSWIPTYDQAGSYPNVGFSVVDDGSPALAAGELITIQVANVNRAPVFTPIATKQLVPGHMLQFTVQAVDPDGNGITYSTGPLSPECTFDPATRVFCWKPAHTADGTYTVTFFATDNGAPARTGQLTVTFVMRAGKVPPRPI